MVSVFLLGLTHLMAQVDVTFSVNMANAGLAGEPVYVAGDFGGDYGTWNEPGTNALCELTDPDADMIYTVSMTLNAGTYQFKFFKGAGWDGGEWAGDPNRTVTIATAFDHLYMWGAKIQDPQVLADFEDGTWGMLTPHVMGCGEYDIEPHTLDETFTIVDNPAPDAMNSSAKVLKFKRWGTVVGGQPWGGFWASIMPNADAEVNKYVHVKLWKPVISPVKFKLENGPAGTLEVGSVNEQQLTGAWEEFVFDFSEKFSQYPVIAFMPDFIEPVPAEFDIYIDDIIINSNPNTSNFVRENTYNKLNVYPNPNTGDFITIESDNKINLSLIHI